jgi:hypothetical protein
MLVLGSLIRARLTLMAAPTKSTLPLVRMQVPSLVLQVSLSTGLSELPPESEGPLQPRTTLMPGRHLE